MIKSKIQNKKNRKKGFFQNFNISLGPISLSFSDDLNKKQQNNKLQENNLDLGPISLSFSDKLDKEKHNNIDTDQVDTSEDKVPSLSNMTSQEWRSKYEKDGYVDLWTEDEFNSGSRLVGGRVVHNGGVYGYKSGEGPSQSSTAKQHSVQIKNIHQDNKVFEVQIPEDRYILYEAEDQGLQLPYACRNGCCTACAVKINKGEIFQPQALGISKELKQKGYGLMCVGYPLSDLELETIQEDEVYDLQFGQSFQTQAIDKQAKSVERDDWAIELALGDE